MHVLAQTLHRRRVAELGLHLPHLDGHAVGGLRRRGPHREPVQAEHAGHLTEQTHGVRGHHRHLDTVRAACVHAHGEPAGAQQVGVRRGEVGRGRHLVPAEQGPCPFDQVGDQCGLPVGPGGRAGGCAVRLGQRVQQVQHLEGAYGGRDVRHRRRVVEVASGGGVGQQQVVAHERDQDLGVLRAETQPRRQVGDDRDARLGVVARPALADVVQQRTDQQQVGPVDVASERGRTDGGLDEVPVDREPVHGVALRPAAHPLPVRQQARGHPGLVQRLPDRRRPAGRRRAG